MDNRNVNDDARNLLKELGLPCGESQLKKRRLRDYQTVQFFNYEQCYVFYARKILNIRQAKIRGEVIVAKPVLLLALIDGVSENIFIDNEFELNDWLEERYIMLMEKYTRSSQFANITEIDNPFWHLSSDGFWNLQCKQLPQTDASPSKRWLKDNVEYAYFDESLWILLQNKTWRMKLRDYIIEHKLMDDNCSRRMVAEGLGVLASIMLAV